jgi:glycosyltransferase involved in cell wall biosynthesis
MKESVRLCAVVPVYRHGEPLAGVVRELIEKSIPVIVVDDGNDEVVKIHIAKVQASYPETMVVTLPVNRGKGAAVMAGMDKALSLGYTHALQVDADGQHGLETLESVISIVREQPEALVCGYPVYDDSVPSARKNGRKFTNLWVSIETLSRGIVDAMCGFRVYPVAKTCETFHRRSIGKRMTFDIEVIVQLHWSGMPMRFLPIRVVYPEGGVSNFRMFRDNVAISLMHTKLFFGMIFRLPVLLFRKVRRHVG